MKIDELIPIGNFLLSMAAIVLSLGKRSSDMNNTDADTIGSLYDTIKKQDTMFKDLKREFDEYKKVTTQQISSLVAENAELRHKLRAYESKITE